MLTFIPVLMGYGFCVESNPADTFNMDFSPVLSRRLELVIARLHGEPGLGDKPFPDKHWLSLKDGQPRFSPFFLYACRLALQIRREDDDWTTDDKSVSALEILANDTLSRNKLHIVGSIIMILQQKRDMIRKHDKNLPPKPQNDKQKYASIYRSNQLDILEGTLESFSTTFGFIMQLKWRQSDQPRVPSPLGHFD